MTASLLVTGANSFIGSSLIRHLIKRDEMKIVATYRQNKESLVDLSTDQLKYVACDLSDSSAVSRLFEDYNVGSVVHLAAARPGQKGIDFSKIVERDNIKAVKNLLQMAVTKDCKRFIFASAIAVYDGLKGVGNDLLENLRPSPTSIFGQSKLAGEDLVRQFSGNSLQGVSLRWPGVHGPGKNKGAVFHFFKAALSQAPLNILEPHSRFRLLFIEDAIQSILIALNEELPGSYCCYNVAGLEIFNLEALARRILEVTKSKSSLELKKNATYRHQVLNIEKIQTELHFKPAPFRQHLLSYLDFLEGRNGQCV
ncbi:MAG: nucleoside-diphosphate-sugar epimerase [Nitrospinales bacterium]|jgi:nucleoside-diphosphate-sugar epimerase